MNIPKYNEARIALGLSPATVWSDISSKLSVQNALKSIYYSNISLVEAYVGAIAEDVVDGTVGPLMKASIYEQYTRIRNGDRNWFENAGVLSKAEFADLQTMSMQSLISLNSQVNISNPFEVQTTLTITSSRLFISPDYYIDYSVNDTFIKFTVVSNYTWLGFGLGSTMNDLDIFLITQSGKTWSIQNSHASYQGVITPNAISSIVEYNQITAFGSKPMIFSFKRALISKTEFTIKNAVQPVAFAYGDGPFQYHGTNRGVIRVNFYSQTQSSTPSLNIGDYSFFFGFHGLIMGFVFLVATPIGIFVARYYPDTKKWLSYHQLLMSMVVSTSMSTAITAIMGNITRNAELTLHAVVGYVITAILATISLSGFLSARLPLPIYVKWHNRIRMYHKYLGMFSFLAASTNCIIGAISYSINPGFGFLPYLVALIPFISVSLLSTYHYFDNRYILENQKNVKKYKNDVLPIYTWNQINDKIASGYVLLVIENTVA